MNRCIDIERARGVEGLEDLKRRMNRERVDNPAGLPQPKFVPEQNEGKALGGASRGKDAGEGTGLFFDQAADAGMGSDEQGSQANGDLFDAR